MLAISGQSFQSCTGQRSGSEADVWRAQGSEQSLMQIRLELQESPVSTICYGGKRELRSGVIAQWSGALHFRRPEDESAQEAACIEESRACHAPRPPWLSRSAFERFHAYAGFATVTC